MSFGFGFGFPGLVSTSGGPSLSYNFVGTASLDPQITFTRASTGTYYNSSGLLTSAAINAPRFDYNPSTLASQGLLIEEQRTNSIRNNTMVGAVAGTPGTLPTNWFVSTSGGLSTQVVGTGVQNGITYIDIRAFGTSTGTLFVVRADAAIAALNGQTWTISQWVSIVGGSLTNVNSVILAAGISAGTSQPTLNFTPTTTFTRYLATATLNADANLDPRPFGITFNNGVAIDITLRIGLPQLEQGAFPTSVIPTSTVAVTRAADIATVNTLTPWYNASEGSLFAEFNIPYALAAASSVPRLFTLQGAGGPSVDELIFLVNQPSGKAASFNAFTAGVNAGRVDSTPAFVANTITKAAAKYALNSRAVTANNTTPVTSATVYTIPTITVARLGSQDDVFANGFLNGYLRRVAYYPRALSDTELQGITT